VNLAELVQGSCRGEFPRDHAKNSAARLAGEEQDTGTCARSEGTCIAHTGDMSAISLTATRARRGPVSLVAYLRGASLRNVVTAPAIYSLAIPFALLDLCVTAYQHTCFPACGIAPVLRSRYFRFDRQRLPYLNAVEKANCAFCSYANGVLAYVREVASRTETYWCPIKHARPIRDAHRRYTTFFDYGDPQAYESGLSRMRRTVTRPRLDASS